MSVVAWLAAAFHLCVGILALVVAAQPALNLFRSSFREPRALLALWLATAITAALLAIARAWIERARTRSFAFRMRAPDIAALCALTASTTLALASLAPFSCVQAAGVLPQFTWVYLAVHALLVVVIAWRATPERQLQHQILVLLVIAGLNGRLFSNDIAVPMLLLVSAWLTFMQRGRADGFALPWSKLSLVLIGLVAWTAVAAWNSTEPDRSQLAWTTFAFFAGLALLVAAWVKSATDAWKVVLAVLAVSTILAAFALTIALVAWPHATPRAIFNTRFLVLNQHPNLVAPHYGIAIILALGLGLAATRRLVRYAAFTLAAALLVAVTQAGSKASLGATVLAALLLLVLRAPRLESIARTLLRPKLLALAVGATALAIVAFVQFAPPGMKSRFSIAGLRQSFGYRVDIWSATTTVIGQHPLLGVGPENYREAASYIENTQVQGEKREPHPHNLLLAVAQATGLPGAALFVALVLGFFGLAIKFVRKLAGDSRRDVVAAIGAASLVPMICGITDVGPGLGAFLPGAWIVFIGVLAAIASRDRSDQPGRSWSPHPLATLVVLPIATWIAYTIAVVPARADAAVYEGRALLRAGDVIQGLAAFLRAQRLDPLNRSTALTVVDLWQRQPARDATEREKNLDAAEAALAETARRWPLDPGNDLLFVELNRARGRTAQALAALEKAVARLPDMVTAAPHHVTLGALRAQTGDRDGAFASWRKAMELDVATVNVIPWQKQRRADGFDDQYVEIQATRPDGTTELQGFRAEDIFKSIEADLEREAEAGAPPNVAGWFRVYHLYFNAHDYADAERALQRIQSIANKNPTVVARELGDLRKSQGRLAEAVAYYEQGLAAGDNIAFRMEASKAYRKLGNLQLARDHMLATLRFKEDFVATADQHAEIYKTIGEICAETNDRSSAIESLQHALFFTSTPKARLELFAQIATQERLFGHPERALRTCLRGADLLSRAAIDLVQHGFENPVRTLALETVRNAQALDPTGAALRRTIESLEELHSSSPGLAVYEAHLELANGNAAAAHVAIERARRQSPMNRIGRLAAFDVLIAARRTEQSDAFLAQLREIGQSTSYEQLRESQLLREHAAQTRAGTISWELQRDVGDFFLSRREFDRAAEFYGHALEQRPEDPELFVRMGRAHYLAGKGKEAIEWFQRANAADPDCRVYFQLMTGIAP